MRQPRDTVLLYDHSGHNFTCELARDLRADGLPIIYAYTAGTVAPRGRLQTSEDLPIIPIGQGRVFERYKLAARVAGEIRLGLEAVRLTRRSRISHVITCNMPVITVAILAAWSTLTHRRFTVWFQDSQAGIAASMVKSSLALRLVGLVEGWGLGRAERVIAISDAMVNEALRMGVKRDRIALLPNWAPIEQIPVLDKVNEWSVREGLSETFVFLYSGTLGLKHSPERLLELARWIKQEGHNATVLVVSEGPFVEALAADAAAEDLPLVRKTYQPAEVLPQVLATADVCLVLLDQHASEFSVPSKVWSYMCAGRPILGCMPLENAAAQCIQVVRCGLVTASGSGMLAAAGRFYDDRPTGIGLAGRIEAEKRFNSATIRRAFAASASLSSSSDGRSE